MSALLTAAAILAALMGAVIVASAAHTAYQALAWAWDWITGKEADEL